MGCCKQRGGDWTKIGKPGNAFFLGAACKGGIEMRPIERYFVGIFNLRGFLSFLVG